MDWFLGVFIFIFGLLVGSFLNVCIYRIPRGNFFEENNSYCPHCRSKLKWYDLFPVFSFIALKGRCRVCREKISIRYPIVEILNAFSWTFLYFAYGISILSLLTIIFTSILIIVVFIDIDIMEIPNGLIIALMIPAIVIFVLAFFNNGYELWWEHLIGMVSVSLVLFVITLITKGGIGMGDIKLMVPIGLFLGWRRTLIATFFGIIIAAIIGIILIACYGKSRKAQMPLAPSLALGYVIAVFFGADIINALGY